MIDEFSEDMQPLPFNFYFDNLFTSMNLLQHLSKYSGTGTLRKNRLPKDCSLSSVDEMKNLVRGSYRYVYSKEKGIIIVRWVDKSVVTVASNRHEVSPPGTAKRYCRDNSVYMYFLKNKLD